MQARWQFCRALAASIAVAFPDGDLLGFPCDVVLEDPTARSAFTNANTETADIGVEVGEFGPALGQMQVGGGGSTKFQGCSRVAGVGPGQVDAVANCSPSGATRLLVSVD